MDADCETVTVTFKLRRDRRQLLDALAAEGHRSRNRQVQRFVELALADRPDGGRRE